MSTTDLLNQIRQKVIAENLSKESKEQTRKLVAFLEVVPQKKMLDDAQYLLNDLLPRILANKGDKSAEYVFFRGLVDTIMWAMFILQRYDSLLSKYDYTQLMAEMYKSRMEISERELLKYVTVEDLMMTETMKDVQDAIAKRSEEWIKTLTEK